MDKIYRIMVDDKPGVLDRIVGLIRRQGVNISFLLVFSTSVEGQSVLYIKLEGGHTDDNISDRLREIDSVHNLDTMDDRISERIVDEWGC